MYHAPIRELRFVLEELLGSEVLRACRGLADYSAQLVESVLGEAARFAEEILDPLNQSGDRQGARLTADGVVTADGFRAAYLQFVDGGWPQLGIESEHGGQDVPQVLSTAVKELWAAANLSFKLCPMLTQGAVEALLLCGTAEQQRLYLPRMIRGEWTGTMVLTEPQAGSDLGLIRTRAVPEGDHYRLFGQKIFITWGDHDYTDNIIHMVLARVAGAPAGVRGISLFVVPKVLVNADGTLGQRNEVRCTSIEHKLGIHASPTCAMAFGDAGGAFGYLVGEANRGLEYMFVMMNAARLAVGVEGYAVAERAFQRARDWARNRVQGKPPVAAPQGPSTIVHHPDVKRMLLTMKSGTQAMRSLALYASLQLDLADRHPDEQRRTAALARAELLIPIVKGWCTEFGYEIAGIGIQVHGGMGFIEETGAAQYLRDVRITTIYEGTTGIQSNDLIGRKLGRDHGAAMRDLIKEMTLDLQPAVAGEASAKAALEAVGRLRAATESILRALASRPERASAVSVPYLELCGLVTGGWLMAKSAVLAAARHADPEAEFYAALLQTARFYTQHVLLRSLTLAAVVAGGADCVSAAEATLI